MLNRFDATVAALALLSAVAGAETFDLALPPGFDAVGIAPGPAGDLIVAGNREVAPDDRRAVVLRLDRDGALVWARELEVLGGAPLRGMDARADRFVALIGGRSTNSLADPTNGVVWVARIDFDGQVLWTRTAGSPLTLGTATAVAVGPDGRVHATGTTHDQPDPQSGDSVYRVSAWSWLADGSSVASSAALHPQLQSDNGFLHAGGPIVALPDGGAVFAGRYRPDCCTDAGLLVRHASTATGSVAQDYWDFQSSAIADLGRLPDGRFVAIGTASGDSFRRFDASLGFEAGTALAEVSPRAVSTDRWPTLIGGSRFVSGVGWTPVLVEVDGGGQPLAGVTIAGLGAVTDVVQTTDGGVAALVDGARLVKLDSALDAQGACAGLTQPFLPAATPIGFNADGATDPSIAASFGGSQAAAVTTPQVALSATCGDDAPTVAALGGQPGQTLAFDHDFPSLPGGLAVTVVALQASPGAAPTLLPGPAGLELELTPDALSFALLAQAPALLAPLDGSGSGSTTPIAVPSDPALAGLALEFAGLGIGGSLGFEAVTATGGLVL